MKKRELPHQKRNLQSDPEQRHRAAEWQCPRSTPDAAVTSMSKQSKVCWDFLIFYTKCLKIIVVGFNIPVLRCFQLAFHHQHPGTWGFPWDLCLHHDEPNRPYTIMKLRFSILRWCYGVSIHPFLIRNMELIYFFFFTSHEGLKRSLQSSSQKLSRGHSFV